MGTKAKKATVKKSLKKVNAIKPSEAADFLV
jgi:hypothetical protein